MRYLNQRGNTINLFPTEDWQYVAGYWINSSGEVINIPETIAENGGTLALDEPKERKVILLALQYAKQRRERNILTLSREIANLEKAINQL